MSVSIFGMPLVDALVGDEAVQLAELRRLRSAVFQAMPLPPLPILFISGPSAVKRL